MHKKDDNEWKNAVHMRADQVRNEWREIIRSIAVRIDFDVLVEKWMSEGSEVVWINAFYLDGIRIVSVTIVMVNAMNYQSNKR